MNPSPLRELSPNPKAIGPLRSRHEELLDQCARQLNVRGVMRTSLAEVAAKLGVSRGALYHYVSGREDLLFQCYRRAAQMTDARLSESVRINSNPAEALRDFAVRMMDPNGPEIAARTEIAMLNAPQRMAIQALQEALVSRLADLIQSGQRAGVFRTCDPDINARIALSVTAWGPLSRRWIDAVDPKGPHRLVAAAAQTLTDSLASPAAVGDFTPIDLSDLVRGNHRAFDRDGASAAKRELILQTASRLFNRKGVDSTSLEEIAAEAGATKRTVYHHVGNKQALLVACFERAYRIFFLIIDRMKQHSGTRLQALTAAIHAVALVYPDEELTPLSPLVGYALLPHKAQIKMSEYGLRLSEDYRSVVRLGVKEGSMREVDVIPRTIMLAGLTSWLLRESVPNEPARRQQIASEIGQFVMAGFAKQSLPLQPSGR